MKRLTTNTKENLNANRKNILLTGYRVEDSSYKNYNMFMERAIKDADIWYIDDGSVSAEEIGNMDLVVHMNIADADILCDAPEHCKEVTAVARECGVPIIAVADNYGKHWCGCDLPSGQKSIVLNGGEIIDPETSLFMRSIKAILSDGSEDPMDTAIKAFWMGEENANELMLTASEQGNIRQMMVATEFFAINGCHNEVLALLKRIWGCIATADVDRCNNIFAMMNKVTSYIGKNRPNGLENSDIEIINMMIQERIKMAERILEIEDNEPSRLAAALLYRENMNNARMLKDEFLLRTFRFVRELPVNFFTIETVVATYSDMFYQADRGVVGKLCPEELTEELRSRLEKSGYADYASVAWKEMLLKTAEIYETKGRFEKAIYYYKLAYKLVEKCLKEHTSHNVSATETADINKNISRLEEKMTKKADNKNHLLEEAFRLLQENK